MNSLGKRIYHIRKSEGLTQKAFANKLGITPSYVSKLEADKESASEILIKLICAEFMINQNWLCTGEGEAQDSFSDYDETDSIVTAGSALSSLMTLMETTSTVRYSRYSHTLDAIVEILYADKLNSTNTFSYLEDVEMLLSYLVRHVSACNRLLLDKPVKDEDIENTIEMLIGGLYCTGLAVVDITSSYLQQSVENGCITMQIKEKIFNRLSDAILPLRRK